MLNDLSVSSLNPHHPQMSSELGSLSRLALFAAVVACMLSAVTEVSCQFGAPPPSPGLARHLRSPNLWPIRWSIPELARHLSLPLQAAPRAKRQISPAQQLQEYLDLYAYPQVR